MPVARLAEVTAPAGSPGVPPLLLQHSSQIDQSVSSDVWAALPEGSNLLRSAVHEGHEAMPGPAFSMCHMSNVPIYNHRAACEELTMPVMVRLSWVTIEEPALCIPVIVRLSCVATDEPALAMAPPL